MPSCAECVLTVGATVGSLGECGDIDCYEERMKTVWCHYQYTTTEYGVLGPEQCKKCVYKCAETGKLVPRYLTFAEECPKAIPVTVTQWKKISCAAVPEEKRKHWRELGDWETYI